MKKKITSLLLVVATAAILFSFVGCSLLGPKDKTFSKEGMTITLTNEFTEQEIITQTAYYVSNEAIVTALKEDGTTLGNRTAADYAKLVCTVNKLTSSEVVAKDGYAEFTYEKEVSGKSYYYYARCFKNGTDFWLIQFACDKKDKNHYTPIFDKWASSVTFSSQV